MSVIPLHTAGSPPAPAAPPPGKRPAANDSAARPPQRSGSRFGALADAWLPRLVLSPTIIASLVFVYGFIASILPVWMLLTPRDYLSTFMKIGVIVLLAEHNRYRHNQLEVDFTLGQKNFAYLFRDGQAFKL